MKSTVDYQRVYTSFIPETRDWPEDERWLAAYLLMCEHRNTEGLFRLPRAYMAHDMGWDVERTERAVSALQERGWLYVQNDWVLITKALRWSQPKGAPQVTGACRRVQDAPKPSPIWDRFMDAAHMWTTEFFRALRHYYPVGRAEDPPDPPEAPSKPPRIPIG